jgi:hypothetical protein
MSSMLGTSLPAISSSGRAGVTSNCSNVPSSYSRTTDWAVTMTAITCSSIATRPGMMKIRSFRLGLYSTRVAVVMGAVLSSTPRRRALSEANASARA